MEDLTNGINREPKGYTGTYFLASFGLFFAIMTATMGGLVLKLQSINGVFTAVDKEQRALALSHATADIALVIGLGALFALFAQPLAGRLSDRCTAKWGMRRPWIIIGAIGVFVCLLIIGISKNVIVILIAFCLAQTFSNFAQAAETATLPDQVPPKRRGYVSGVVGMCLPLSILCISIGLNYMKTDFARFAIPASVGLVFGLLFALVLKDRVLTERPEKLTAKSFFTSFVFNPKKYPDLGWAWLSKFFVMFGFCTIGTYLMVFLSSKFTMSETEQTHYNMLLNFLSVICMVILSFVGGRLSDKFGKRRVFVAFGGVITAVGILLFAICSIVSVFSIGIIIIFVGEAFLGLGMGCFFATDVALCADILPDKKNVAKDLGVLNIANALPQSIAPAVAGPIINLFGISTLGFTVWFIIGAIFCALGGIVIFKVKTVK
jgi:MFS family permease